MRVHKHLEAGVQPSLKGRRVVLKVVVLVRAGGRDTPVAQEARRLVPHVDLSYWSGNVEGQRDRVVAYDCEGKKHTVTQREAGEHVAMQAGRMFYEEAPLTEWLTHLPMVDVHNGQTFNECYIGMTPEKLKSIYSPEAP